MKNKQLLLPLALISLGAVTTYASAFNGDEQCGSYENACICDDVQEDGTCAGGPNGG